MRKPFVAANWKSYGAQADIAVYLRELIVPKDVDVVVFPAAVYIPAFVAAGVGQLEVGAQDVGEFQEGAHTGEVAARMIKDVGAEWTLVGHSERRQDQGESDALVARKVGAAVAANVRPVLCVGETLSERDEGRASMVVARQLDAVIAQVGIAPLTTGVVAYEPVWAIGTGKTASPEAAQEMHAFIRAHVGETDTEAARALRIVYGGSVKPDNALGLFGQQDIDGGLVGGASLDADQFSAILAAALQGD